MPKQVDVLVKDISRDEQGQPTELHGVERVLTYKSFLYLNADPDRPRYELIGEVESVTKDPITGKDVIKLAEGNPNLNAQHRQVQPKPSAAPVVNAGPSAKELELMAEIEKLKSQQAEPEKKKPGPKPKAKPALEGATV